MPTSPGSGAVRISPRISDLDTTQENAREQTHKHMRQQTEKLSTEIRRNFKSTFKTVTEETGHVEQALRALE